MKPKAKVAVITRTKNRPVLLVRAIESVLGQTYADWVMIIVNDGGDSGQVDKLINKYASRARERLHIIHNTTSLGMEAASNKGISYCESDYVAIHDDDDTWHPDFLSKTVSFIENDTTYPELGGVVTYMERVQEKIDGDNVIEQSREDCRHWIKDMTLWSMCGGNFFPPISFVYRRKVFEKIGGMYDENLPVLGDWEFNLRFMQYYNIGLIREVLSYYHHRIEDKDSNYSNTVIVGNDRHVLYSEIIRNNFLRKDIGEGKLGVGYIINEATSMRHINDQVIQQSDKLLAASTAGIDKMLNHIDRSFKTLSYQTDFLVTSTRDISNKLYKISSPFRFIKRFFNFNKSK